MKKIRKLVLYFPESLSKMSGTPFRIIRVAEFLAKEGFDVTLIAKDIKEEDIKEFKFKRLRKRNILRYIDKGFVLKVIKELKPDIWYSFTEVSLPSTAKICKKYNIKHVVELHSSFIEEVIYKKGLRISEKNIIYKIIDKKITNWLKQANCVIVLTDAQKKHYEGSIKNIQIMFPGSDKRIFNSEKKPIKELVELKRKKIILTYAGNFNKYQGADLLFEVICDIKKRNIDDFIFLLMGGDIEPYRKFIKKNELENLIFYAGKPDLKDTAKFLSGTDFFVVAKDSWSGAKYIFASKYCDYVVMHKPIISTNIGEAALKLVKKNGLLVGPTKEALVEGILKIKDKKWKNEVTKYAKEMNIDAYTIEENIKQLKKIMEEI